MTEAPRIKPAQSLALDEETLNRFLNEIAAHAA